MMVGSCQGKGGGGGWVDYLLGKKRNGKGQRCLRVIRKIANCVDATPFAKKYTSGVI
ncbi:hypothetical protein ACSGGA_24835 [Salmonella enterica]